MIADHLDEFEGRNGVVSTDCAHMSRELPSGQFSFSATLFPLIALFVSVQHALPSDEVCAQVLVRDVILLAVVFVGVTLVNRDHFVSFAKHNVTQTQEQFALKELFNQVTDEFVIHFLLVVLHVVHQIHNLVFFYSPLFFVSKSSICIYPSFSPLGFIKLEYFENELANNASKHVLQRFWQVLTHIPASLNLVVLFTDASIVEHVLVKKHPPELVGLQLQILKQRLLLQSCNQKLNVLLSLVESSFARVHPQFSCTCMHNFAAKLLNCGQQLQIEFESEFVDESVEKGVVET